MKDRGDVMEYAIAYNDKSGNGFTKTEPWILDDFDNRKECIKKANKLIRSGYKNVTVFNYDESVPECIDWDYVKQHQN